MWGNSTLLIGENLLKKNIEKEEILNNQVEKVFWPQIMQYTVTH